MARPLRPRPASSEGGAADRSAFSPRPVSVLVDAPRARGLLAAAVAGSLVAAAFLDFSLFGLAWVAFAPLVWAVGRASSRRDAVRLGLVAGLTTNIPAFYWLVYTIHVFGGFPWLVAVFFYLCLSTYSAGQFALFALLLHRLGHGPLFLGPPLLWVALEFLYPNLFPWRLASSQFHVPLLIQVGDLTGPFALSFVMVWTSAALVALLDRPRRLKPLVGAMVSTALVAGYGFLRIPAIERAIAAAPVVRVGLVQGNVGIREKGDAAFFEINVDRYRELSDGLADQVDLVVWPESVVHTWVPIDATRIPADLDPYSGLRSYLIYGGLAFDEPVPGQFEKFNSAFLLGSGGRILGRYDKLVLLPFGEYLPGASLIPALAELSPQTGDFTPGRSVATLDVPGLARVGSLICYEDVPAGMARAMTQAGAELLLNMFNDAWFGATAAPYQHEALALWRAVENRRFFVRAGNAGVTGAIDPVGRVVGRLGLFTEDTLLVSVRPLAISTFYTRFGDVFGWTVVLLAFVWLARSFRIGWRAERRQTAGGESFDSTTSGKGGAR